MFQSLFFWPRLQPYLKFPLSAITFIIFAFCFLSVGCSPIAPDLAGIGVSSQLKYEMFLLLHFLSYDHSSLLTPLADFKDVHLVIIA